MSAGQYGPAASLAADRQPYTSAWVYLLRCADGSLYAGWTNDLARRLRAHRSGQGGAKYTRSHGGAAVRLAYAERCAGKSEALRREAALKRLSKSEKEQLAAGWAARSALTLRMATPEDAPAVTELYNWYVTHGTQTFQYEPSTVEEYRQNIAGVLRAAPFLVACTAEGTLAGFACAHPWHTRRAFAWDVETTVYCDPGCVGQGVGRRLYTALLELLRRQGYMNAFALITRPNHTGRWASPATGWKRTAATSSAAGWTWATGRCPSTRPPTRPPRCACGWKRRRPRRCCAGTPRRRNSAYCNVYSCRKWRARCADCPKTERK